MGKTFAQLAVNPVQFPKKEIFLPELDMTLSILTLTGLQHRQLLDLYRSDNGEGKNMGEAQMAASLISISVVDEDGKFPDASMVIGWPVSLILRLANAINEFNAVGADSQADIEKK